MDLWTFLEQKTERSLGLPERVELAKKFSEKFEEIRAKHYYHRDLKPQNVLLNLTPDEKWNGEMEITDFGIANKNDYNAEKAANSGWTEGYQFTDGTESDKFAARLVVLIILLSWNKAWWFIWDGTPTVDQNNPVEKLFLECKEWKDTEKLLSEISSGIGCHKFCEDWTLYCRSATANIQVDSNTQKSINMEKLLSKINLDRGEVVTNGTEIHGQDFTNLCHSFAIVTSLRRELTSVMDLKKRNIIKRPCRF